MMPLSFAAVLLAAKAIVIPDVTLVDQDGARVALREVFGEQAVVVSFVYTTCSTVCAPTAALFAELQRVLGPDHPAHLVTISLDPATDTPDRLTAFGARFGRKPGWTLLTGAPRDVQVALRALGGEVAAKETHAPLVLVGHAPSQRWERIAGLPPVASLVQRLETLEATLRADADARYFTNSQVIDQSGHRFRFYDDLVRGRLVMINFGFTSCSTGCSPAAKNLEKVQALLGQKLGRDVQMLTLSVDPTHDTPQRLEVFAQRFHARPGWHFLTGDPTEMLALLRRFGVDTSKPEAHSLVLLLGDTRHGVWTKAHALDAPEELVAALERLGAPP